MLADCRLILTSVRPNVLLVLEPEMTDDCISRRHLAGTSFLVSFWLKLSLLKILLQNKIVRMLVNCIEHRVHVVVM